MGNLKQKGFTLIELLIVIAILAIIGAAVFVALNPAKRLGEANDAARWSDVNQILSAIHQYTIDNQGDIPNDGTGDWDNNNYNVLGTGAVTTCDTCAAVTGTIDGDCLTFTDLTGTYLGSIPEDPRYGSEADTQYYVQRNTSNIVTVGACQTSSYAPGPIKVVR
ncbi:prepilin-type N-terminal cleavage/methylation domain-containing protein [Patescibacteria group bacterium]|nr:prepilin-type N-terminal cleavage/methylation domain-containing protein [Patescibacteria group bacterium]